MLDGLGTIDDYVARADGHLAITDHGTLCGVPQFYQTARKAGVEPIIGEEFYYVADATDRPAKGEKPPERCHVVILGRGQRGYEVLAELSTETHRNFYYKPLLDIRMIEQLGADARHLVCLSGCANSEISELVLKDEMGEAEARIQWWREMFPYYYVELQHHGTEFDRKLNTGLIRLARKFRIPWVVTNDPHYVVREDHQHHDALLAIQTAANLEDEDRFRFSGSGYWLKTADEMRSAFRDYQATIWTKGAANTLEVARLCHTRIPQWESRSWHIPPYPGVEDAQRELVRLARTGLRARGLEGDSRYRARMDRELADFATAGIASFMLITVECVQWAKEQGIRVGPGRGSVCGTLVGYLIGIHKIDPVKYDLKFERFLNIARPKMPDIDSDFEPGRRGEMFVHVAEKYGIENCVHVAAYQSMKVRAAFGSLAKSYGVEFTDRLRLAKLLPKAGASDDDQADLDEDSFTAEFLTAIEGYEYDGVPFRETLLRLAGIKRSIQAHPAGVIIADPADHIRRIVPEMWLASSKQMCGQYDLEAVEELGLLKQDFLGLRTLETITECIRLVEERTGEVVDPDAWVPDDEPDDDKVYELLATGATAGVFQLEGATNTAGIKAIQPVCFEDIVSCTSLYRTGAISAGFPKIFLANRRAGDTTAVEYAHPALEPILGRSWGVVLYQEQVMEMGERIAGFSMEQVDDIKEAIKHKKSTRMAAMRPLFVRGAMRTVGATKTEAREMWRMIEGYSGYGYNRSHAVAYSFLTYQTARLKQLYPREFACALLRTVKAKKEHVQKRALYLADVRGSGEDVKINGPHINRSDVGAIPTTRGIRFGFEDLAGIGAKQAKKIVDGRPEGGYTSLDEVAKVVNNVGVMEVLRNSCALAELGEPGERRLRDQLLNYQSRDALAQFRDEFEGLLVRPEDRDDPDEYVSLYGEIITRTVGASKKNKSPYLTLHVRWSAADTWNVRLWSSTEHIWDYLEVGTVVRIHGKWEDDWENVSLGGHAGVTVFPKDIPRKVRLRRA